MEHTDDQRHEYVDAGLSIGKRIEWGCVYHEGCAVNRGVEAILTQQKMNLALNSLTIYFFLLWFPLPQRNALVDDNSQGAVGRSRKKQFVPSPSVVHVARGSTCTGPCATQDL